MDIVPSPMGFQYDKGAISGLRQLEAKYHELGPIPSAEFWREHSYPMAVDLDPKTCWNTFRSMFFSKRREKRSTFFPSDAFYA